MKLSSQPPRLVVKTLGVTFVTTALLLAVTFVVVIVSVGDQVRAGVAANLEEAAVDVADPFRAGPSDGVAEVEELVPAPVGVGRPVAVDVRPHRPVEDKDAVVENGEEVFGHRCGRCVSQSGERAASAAG